MIVKVRDTKQASKEPVMEVFLAQRNGCVKVRGVDQFGQEWTIGELSPYGLHLRGGIESSSGWPLDEEGRLVLVS